MIKKILIVIVLILPSCNIFDKDNRLFNKGLKSFEGQDYSSAIQYFSKSIEHNNLNYYAFKMRGFSYGLQFKFDSAITDISRSNRMNIIISKDILEERYTICKDSYLLGMMNYYLHEDDVALKYLKVSISFNPMEIIDWNKAIEKQISKDYEFKYDIDYTTLYLECLILCGRLCMEDHRIPEAFYFLYKAKDLFSLRKIPYIMLQQALKISGDSIGSETIIKEYDQLMYSIETENRYSITKIELSTDRQMQNLERSSYEEDRKKISCGIIQELKDKNPRFDIDSIFSFGF